MLAISWNLVYGSASKSTLNHGTSYWFSGWYRFTPSSKTQWSANRSGRGTKTPATVPRSTTPSRSVVFILLSFFDNLNLERHHRSYRSWKRKKWWKMKSFLSLKSWWLWFKTFSFPSFSVKLISLLLASLFEGVKGFALNRRSYCYQEKGLRTWNHGRGDSETREPRVLLCSTLIADFD